MQRTSNCHVTVSLPYFQCKQQVRRAVESILGQTHTDLTLVVVNDGDDDPPWDQLADIRDPRLLRFDLKSNHGRYFADAVVLNATADPYFLVQNANDWSDPERISISLEVIREDHADAAISAEYQYRMIAGKVVSKVKKGYATMNRSLTYSFENRASYCGLFRTEALREIGGTYAGFHTGYGVLLLHFLLMTGSVSYIGDPLYHRVIQSDSFKHGTGTRMISATRREVALQLEKLYNETFELYIEYLAGQIEAETLARLIRQICNRGVTQKDQVDLIEESNRLRAILASC
jgi:glycosyltransferase involved in cell wall biosynthesis